MLFDLGSLSMAPVRDPIKNLVFTGKRSDVHAVMVDGRFVVEEGRLTGVDEREVTRDLQGAAERLRRRVPERDWGRRTIDQISPPSFPVV